MGSVAASSIGLPVASSRIRCKLLDVLPSAPSATCAREMPSFALRAAWFRPRICEVMRSVMAKPAASSLALLMRKPDDRRCIDVVKEAWDIDKLRCAVSDWILVLIVEAIAKLLKRMNRRRRRLQSLRTCRQSVTMG